MSRKLSSQGDFLLSCQQICILHAEDSLLHRCCQVSCRIERLLQVCNSCHSAEAALKHESVLYELEGHTWSKNWLRTMLKSQCGG